MRIREYSLDNHFRYYVENIINKEAVPEVEFQCAGLGQIRDRVEQRGAAGERVLCGITAWMIRSGGGVGRLDAMRRVAGLNRGNGPVAYDIRDELSTTYSANPFDYDFNPVALARFRDVAEDAIQGPRGVERGMGDPDLPRGMR